MWPIVMAIFSILEPTFAIGDTANTSELDVSDITEIIRNIIHIT